MIPQAGSAYAYAYATLGEVVAWIIGWDLILEYAVGNVAVAISWGDYFTTLTRGVGIDLRLVDHRVSHRVTEFECRRSGTARDGATHCRRTAARERASLRDCHGHHVLLLRGARESSTANNVMVVVKLLALGLFVAVGLMNIDAANYAPFAPNGFTGIHQGAAIVFFVHIGFDAVSTAAEETRNPQRNLPIGILGGLAVCTVVYVIVGAVLTGMVRVRSTRGRRPAGPCARIGGIRRRWLAGGAGRGRLHVCGAPGVSCTVSRASSLRWHATGSCPHGRAWIAKRAFPTRRRS